MRTSWILLTYNRAATVARALVHNVATAGHKWDELIWCDNGSTDGVREVVQKYLPDVSILNKTNLGVPHGYNRALALASGTHVVITGCDVLMPENWLFKFKQAFDKVPNMGIATIYCEPIEKTPERIRGQEENIDGMRLRPAMPIGRRMLSTQLLREIGFFHHGFSPYSWDDVAWGHRAEKVCVERGLRFLNLVGEIGVHLGTEGNVGYDHKDEHEYWRWKREHVNDPKKLALMERLRSAGWPKFSPYCSCGIDKEVL